MRVGRVFAAVAVTSGVPLGWGYGKPPQQQTRRGRERLRVGARSPSCLWASGGDRLLPVRSEQGRRIKCDAFLSSHGDEGGPVTNRDRPAPAPVGSSGIVEQPQLAGYRGRSTKAIDDRFKGHDREDMTICPFEARTKWHHLSGQNGPRTVGGTSPRQTGMPKAAFRHDDGAETDFLKAVGRRLSWARDVVGITQDQAAEFIGIDQSTYSKYEKGKRLAAPSAMSRFCDLFGVSLDYIYRGRLGGVMRRDVELVLVANHPDLVEPLRQPAQARPAKEEAQAS